MNVALIFAGGTGVRMNSKTKPKQFLKLHGKTILMHTVEHFEYHEDIEFIVVVCIKEWMNSFKRELKRNGYEKVVRIVEGGMTAQESIYHGLLSIKEELKTRDGSSEEIVLIHDGVRPLIDSKVITDNIDGVKAHGSAITTSREYETVAIVDSNGDIEHIDNRDFVRIAKAPQSFYFEEIMEIHDKAHKDGVTGVIDSASLMDYYGRKVHTVIGPSENIKVTTATDFYMFRALLDAKENSQIFG